MKALSFGLRWQRGQINCRGLKRTVWLQRVCKSNKLSFSKFMKQYGSIRMTNDNSKRAATASQANWTDVSRTSANNHVLVFFFITVLVDNSVSLQLNTPPFCLRAQSWLDWLNWFSVLKCDLFVPQSNEHKKYRNEMNHEETPHDFKSPLFFQLPLQVHYSHTCWSTCCIFFHTNNYLNTRLNCSETSEQSPHSSVLENPKLNHLVYHKTHPNQILISLRV